MKSSEIDEISIRTEILEKQQKELMEKERKNERVRFLILSSIATYLITAAIYIIGKVYFEVWNPGVILSELAIATAIVIIINLKYNTNTNTSKD